MSFFIDEIGDVLMSFVLSIVRVLIVLLFIPLFDFKQLKAMLIKVAISFAISLPVFVSIYEQLYQQQMATTKLSFLIIKEVFLGLVIGYVLAMPFWIFSATGAMIDNQRGALSAGYNNPASGPDASMIGDLLQKIVVLVLLFAGFLPHLFSFLYLSHAMWPALASMPEFDHMAWTQIISMFNHLVRQFVLYAGPIILLLLMVEAAFAILGAYSPQLQIYFMAMPAKSLSALLVVVLYFAYLLEFIELELSYYSDLIPIFDTIWKH